MAGSLDPIGSGTAGVEGEIAAVQARLAELGRDMDAGTVAADLHALRDQLRRLHADTAALRLQLDPSSGADDGSSSPQSG
jgi:hypothetical protein